MKETEIAGGVHFHFDIQADKTEPEEVTQLKPVFVRLMSARVGRVYESPEAERTAREETDKELYRAAFMADPWATEADFERLWPRLRDDSLCEHATNVYFQLVDAVAGDDGFGA